MKKRMPYILLFFILNTTVGLAQKKGLYLEPQVGLLNGDHRAGLSLQLSSGISTLHWQFGVISGYDYYKFRTLPVYAEIKRLVGHKKNKAFLYADAGLNIAIPLADERGHYTDWWWGNNSTSSFSNGLIVAGGAGIILPNRKGKGWILSLGYTKKTLTESWTENYWDPLSSEVINTPRSSKYILNRFQLKIGFRVF